MRCLALKNNSAKIRAARRRLGYTYFELIMVVAIIGIAGLIVVPLATGNLTSSRLRTAANILAADIEYTLSECINRPDDPRVIFFEPAQNRYTVNAVSGGTAINHPMDGQPFINNFSTDRNAQLSGITLDSVTMGNSAMALLTFDPYGKPIITSDLLITLRYGQQRLVVQVNRRTGETSIYDAAPLP